LLITETSEPRQWSLRKDLPIGVASGLTIGVLIWVAYWLAFREVIDPDLLEGKVKEFGAYDHYVLFVLFLAIFNSGLEEYYWRWFVFGRLRAKLGLWTAAILSSLAFASHHFVVLQNFFESTLLAGVFSLGIACGGILWAFHFYKTRRLWGVWVSHFLIDIAALSVGYHLLFQTA